uniref:Uncharacterized protein n=1 Tax=Picea glauca TaxID=3330 RepID=A0A101M403_PICGL|nr:hypothetical protein ABT39_MTgene377 [Picea glauca]
MLMGYTSLKLIPAKYLPNCWVRWGSPSMESEKYQA